MKETVVLLVALIASGAFLAYLRWDLTNLSKRPYKRVLGDDDVPGLGPM